MSPRLRFGLRTLPLPRGAAGKHFFADDDALRRLARVFEWLAAEPGLAGATGGTGIGDAMGTPTSPVVWPVRLRFRPPTSGGGAPGPGDL